VPALTSEQARRVYDRIGQAQDWQRFYEDAATADLVAHAGFDAAHAVVELGCGTGRFAAALLAHHLPAEATYVGVDLSPRMVALASDRLRPWRDRATVSLVEGDASFPTADGAADRFVANYVFDLLGPEEVRAALAEARRVLAPGGLLCAAGLTCGESRISRFVSRAWTGVWERWPALVGGCRPVTLVDALEWSRWGVHHRRTVVAWGIASEVVIAVPEPLT
jgi:ubiquinone/menaquinone biosynthesis C-methylase UbiE